MAFVEVHNVAIRGISACVPKKIEENKNLPFYDTPEEAEHLIESIGIARRHVTTSEQTALDLCQKAAEQLLTELQWEKDSIDVLAFVTQDPDYLTHPNSFLVHDKLGFPEQTMCLDFYAGCPGWVLSLSTIGSMLMGGKLRRAIILDGDTSSKVQYACSREEKPLFGDAGTATALEFDENAKPMYFNMGTLSSEGATLIRHNGGFRNPWTTEALQRDIDLKTGRSSDMSGMGIMDGMDVFSFSISKAPKSMKKLCANYGINIVEIDNMFLHQANKLIVENIAKRMSFPMEKTPMSLWEYGNTTSASIPLTMVSERAKELVAKQKNLLCGFGTGLAWGAAYIETENVKCPPIVEL